MKCPKCDGLGYTAEHDTSSHDEDGYCNGSCPIQVQCETCQATGEVPDEWQEKMDRKVLDDNDLPF